MKTQNNLFGYKVCYREDNSKELIRHFITHTYRQAASMKRYYLLYPPRSRIDNHKLKNPKWYIIPINRQEVQKGIWREVPF